LECAWQPIRLGPPSAVTGVIELMPEYLLSPRRNEMGMTVEDKHDAHSMRLQRLVYKHSDLAKQQIQFYLTKTIHGCTFLLGLAFLYVDAPLMND